MMTTAADNDDLLAEYFDDLLTVASGGGLAPVAPTPLPAVSPGECMIFICHGMRLAVTRKDLLGICDFPSRILPPDHAQTLGRTQYQLTTSRIIDLQPLLLPTAGAGDQGSAPYHYLLVLRDGRWALPAHAVSGVHHFQADEVRLRSAATRRTWLAGTSMRRQCAILDVEGLLARVLQPAP